MDTHWYKNYFFAILHFLHLELPKVNFFLSDRTVHIKVLKKCFKTFTNVLYSTHTAVSHIKFKPTLRGSLLGTIFLKVKMIPQKLKILLFFFLNSVFGHVFFLSSHALLYVLYVVFSLFFRDLVIIIVPHLRSPHFTWVNKNTILLLFSG